MFVIMILTTFIGTIIVALASMTFAKDVELIKRRVIKIGEDEDKDLYIYER